MTDNGTELSAWDRVKLARGQDRPHTLDYVNQLTTGFVELHGDRVFGDDQTLIGGLATFHDQTVMVIGHQKGGETKENIARNFGMARPEGYRKAERLMRHAEKFGFPVLSFIDTPGAEPGIGSEERGQATAIAESLLTMAGLRTLCIAVIIGEGGSGGALAIGVADRVLMLENAVYAVASPEAFATILWRDVARAPEAATIMRITARDALQFGVADEIVPEPTAGHEDPATVIRATGDAIWRNLRELQSLFPADDPTTPDRLLAARDARFRRIGVWEQPTPRA